MYAMKTNNMEPPPNHLCSCLTNIIIYIVHFIQIKKKCTFGLLFYQVVEDYAGRWQVPLPQLQVLQTALCCFTSASTSFPDECEHVQYVLSSLAL